MPLKVRLLFQDRE
jgi:hypothetical protein